MFAGGEVQVTDELARELLVSCSAYAIFQYLFSHNYLIQNSPLILLVLIFARARHLMCNRRSGPGWISFLKIGVFYTNFSITTHDLNMLLYVSA